MSSVPGVYIHVPYCKSICPYCDFVKKPVKAGEADRFAEALCREIAAYEGARDIASVFFGGGTPSLLSRDAFGMIFEKLRETFEFDDCEISIEANPDDVDEAALAYWKTIGVNRISLGVQSFDDDALRFLGRVHDAAAARRACDAVSRVFDNWGVDLIFGAQPVETWGATLDTCLSLDPPHISTYGLTYERGTRFWKERDSAIDSDLSLALYREAMERLDGYDHYEVSNFAKAGYQSRHNKIYWRNDEYIGFGPGAYSYREGVRSRNAVSIRNYLERPGAKSETLQLDSREIQVETLIQHFRTLGGLEKGAYEARFGQSIEIDFGATLPALIERGLLVDDGESIRPTVKGYELNNEIGLALVS